MFAHEVAVAHRIGLDGSDGGPAVIGIDRSGTIASVRPGAATALGGLAAIPLLADAHAHLGISDGVTEDPVFHTPELVDAQLRQLARCGIGHLHSLGTDQPWLRDVARRRLAQGDRGGRALAYSAGTGFGAHDGWPPELTRPEPRFRPRDAGAARRQVRELAEAGGRTVKLWVDDFGGTVPKIPAEIIEAIVHEARCRGLVSFAHVFFHADAAMLVAAGIDVLAHAVRDRVMEDRLIEAIGERGTTFVPTLSREEAEWGFSLPDNPFLRDAFFLRVAGPLLPRLRAARSSDDGSIPRRRLDLAMENVSRAHAAGVRIGLGTDSGFRLKLPGFMPHRELKLLCEAGLSPSEALACGLEVNRRLFASALTPIEPGAPASFFLVDGNPSRDISRTQEIREVFVRGERLPGPWA